MKKVVIGLSGGMDSTTLLGLLLEQGFSVHCCLFTYGSKHGKYEHKAALDVAQFYRDRGFTITGRTFDLTTTFMSMNSNLLVHGGNIPEGHYADENMKLTVVPGRNTIFASIMMGVAESIGASYVALGVHSGDHFIYPDCRPNYLKALSRTMIEATEGKVRLMFPLVDDTKETILRMGYNLPIVPPYHLTRTCYKNQPNSCGKCGSCVERLEAFAAIGKVDPIKYD